MKFALMPSGLILALILAGLILAGFRRRRPAALCLLSIAAGLYLVFGSGPVSYALLRSLEGRYPALQVDSIQPPSSVVVLAGYAEARADRPASSNVNAASAARLLEAARLAGRFPEARVLVSGTKQVPWVMREVLVTLGVPADRIDVEDGSTSTYGSAVNLRDRLMGSSFLLVTSAGHMPRAAGVFRRAGLQPVPAPTHYMGTRSTRLVSLLPSPAHLEQSDLAVHEHLGIAWYRLLGRL